MWDAADGLNSYYSSSEDGGAASFWNMDWQKK